MLNTIKEARGRPAGFQHFGANAEEQKTSMTSELKEVTGSSVSITPVRRCISALWELRCRIWLKSNRSWESRSEGNRAVSFSLFQKCKSCTMWPWLDTVTDHPEPIISSCVTRPEAHLHEKQSLVLVTLNEDWNARLFLHPSLGLSIESIWNCVPNSVYFYNLMCFRVKKHEEWLLYSWIEEVLKMNSWRQAKRKVIDKTTKQ